MKINEMTNAAADNAGAGAPSDAAFQNAERTGQLICRTLQRQELHIYELARALLIDPQTGEEKTALSDSGALLQNDTFLREYRKCCESLSCEGAGTESITADDSERTLFSMFSRLSRLRLCRYICEICGKMGHGLPLSVFFGEDSENGANPAREETDVREISLRSRIAYVKNSYSDTAYRVFSHHIDDASVVYPGSFSAVCEEVYYNRVGFCILPYETSDEGVLPGFRMLISKYELVPVLTCPVVTDTAQSGSRVTHFVLLSKNFMRIRPSGKFARGSKEFLKITLDNPDGGMMANVLGAAVCSGLDHVKTESVPISWEDGCYSCSVTFSLRCADNSDSTNSTSGTDNTGGADSSSDIVPFLLYLALEVPESTPNGMYSSVLPYPGM